MTPENSLYGNHSINARSIIFQFSAYVSCLLPIPSACSSSFRSQNPPPALYPKLDTWIRNWLVMTSQPEFHPSHRSFLSSSRLYSPQYMTVYDAHSCHCNTFGIVVVAHMVYETVEGFIIDTLENRGELVLNFLVQLSQTNGHFDRVHNLMIFEHFCR